jgi:hypothetical protein
MIRGDDLSASHVEKHICYSFRSGIHKFMGKLDALASTPMLRASRAARRSRKDASMNGEKKFLLVAFCLGLCSLVILVSWLFVAFWRWKELLALGLIVLLVFIVLSGMTVMLLGALNEQALRRQRVLYHRELPLDAAGRPLYLPDTMRQAHSYIPSSSLYPQQQGESYYE